MRESATAPRVRIAGRVGEQAILAEAVRAASGGSPWVGLVHGEPGVGKTRLVEVACAGARAAGCTVLWGRGVHFAAAPPPYLPLVSALEGWLRVARADERAGLAAAAPGLRDLLPGLGGTGAAAGPADGRMIVALEQAVSWLATRESTVLVLDDLQWIDVTSLDALSFLVAGLVDQRLSLIGIYRDVGLEDGHHLHSWLADLRRLPQVHDIALDRLGVEETADQLELVLGRRPGSGLVADVLGRSGGNAYLNELLVRGLEPGTGRLPDGVPEALRTALLTGWHALSAQTREMVRLVAVSGIPVRSADLGAVAARVGIGPRAYHDAVRQAIAAGVLQPPSRRRGLDVVWFRHPLLAEVLHEAVLPGEAIEVHAAFLGVLEGRRGPDACSLSDLARHAELSGALAKAFDHLVAAAEEAERVQALPERATLLRRAADLWTRLPADQRGGVGREAELYFEAAIASRRAGDDHAAWAAVERAWSAVDRDAAPLTAAKILVLRGELGVATARVPEPIPLYVEAVRLSSPYPDAAEHAEALSELANAEKWCGRSDDALAHAELAVAAATRAGDLGRLALAYGARSFALLSATGGREDAEKAYSYALASGQGPYIGVAAIDLANSYDEVGDIRRCAELYSEAHLIVAQRGIGGLSALLAVYAGQSLLDLGRLEEASAMLRQALVGRSAMFAAIQARQLAMTIAVRRNDLITAAGHLDALRDLTDHFEDYNGLHGVTALAEYLTADGRAREAITVLTEQFARQTRGEPKYGDEIALWGARAAHAWVRLARDRQDEADRIAALAAFEALLAQRAEAGDPFTGEPGNPVQASRHRLYDAEIARLHRGADEPARWEDAVAATRASGERHETAYASMSLAECLLLRREQHAAAAAALRAAHQEATAIGAHRIRDEAEALAALARVSLVVPRQRTARVNAENGQHLTPREQEILTHLITGRTYAEIAAELFISEKTVSVHVSNLLRKTGTSSRVEVAAWARRSGMVPA